MSKDVQQVAIDAGIYGHFKGGLYLVLGTAEHTESHEQIVFYVPMDGDYKGLLRCRPLHMFNELINRPGYPADAQRFRLLTKKPVLRRLIDMQINESVSGANLENHPFEEEKILKFSYKNYKGEISQRAVLPELMYFGSTEFHSVPQSLIEAYDLDKGERRAFALKDMTFPWQRES